MSELFLTREEVAELTGAKTRAKQVQVLQRNGVRHWINAAGWPVVARSAVDGLQAPPAPAQTWRSNRDAA